MGEKSVENLLNSIEESKKRDYTKTLYALGIPYVGKFLGNLLAEQSRNINRLMEMTEEELLYHRRSRGKSSKVCVQLFQRTCKQRDDRKIAKLRCKLFFASGV